jgi:hypothetical protein
MTDIQTERRWFVWRCATEPDKKRYIGNRKVKPSCGLYQPTGTRKWAAARGEWRWQGVCRGCKRKRQLNAGNVWPEPPHYYTKEEAIEKAEELNLEAERVEAIRNNHADPWAEPRKEALL